MGRIVIPGFRKIETRSGGEGGTTNYNDLTNKPSINNVPLVGNLDTVNLKLTDATLTEEGVPAEAKTVGQKLEEHSTSLIALSEQLGNHTVKSDVPENAVFTDTVYDDTEVKESIDELNSNLDELGHGENSGGRNIFQLDKIKCGSMVKNDLVLANQDSEFYEYNWKPNTQYTISGITKNSNSSGRQRLYFQYTDGTNSEAFANFGTDFAFTSLTSDVGKTIKSLNSYWGDNGSLIIKDAEIMIEEGTTATPYEPYIPSVKMLADEVNAQNESLEDYGLDNKFANGLAYGYCSYSGGNFSFEDLTENDNYIGSKTEYSCIGGEPLKILFSQTMEQITIQFNNNSFFTVNNVDKIETVIPSGVTKLSFYVKKNGINYRFEWCTYQFERWANLSREPHFQQQNFEGGMYTADSLIKH